MKIKPAPGARVRHPDGRLLEEGGETVTPSPYWIRRLSAKDVVAVADPAPEASPKKRSAPTATISPSE